MFTFIPQTTVTVCYEKATGEILAVDNNMRKLSYFNVDELKYTIIYPSLTMDILEELKTNLQYYFIDTTKIELKDKRKLPPKEPTAGERLASLENALNELILGGMI